MPLAVTEERRACAILAEQVGAWRARIAAAALFERLVRCSDLLGVLISQLEPASAARATAAQLDRALDDLTFSQAQHEDITRQTAELLMQALHALGPAGGRLSLAALKKLYISEAQRQLHEAMEKEV